jgi:hypothetical protein
MTLENLQHMLWLANSGIYSVHELARFFHEEPEVIAKQIIIHELPIKKTPLNRYFRQYPRLLYYKEKPKATSYQDYLKNAGYDPKKVKQNSRYFIWTYGTIQ